MPLVIGIIASARTAMSLQLAIKLVSPEFKYVIMTIHKSRTKANR